MATIINGLYNKIAKTKCRFVGTLCLFIIIVLLFQTNTTGYKKNPGYLNNRDSVCLQMSVSIVNCD